MNQDNLDLQGTQYILYPQLHYRRGFWGCDSIQDQSQYCISKTGVDIHEIEELLTPTPKLIQTESGIRIENELYLR